MAAVTLESLKKQLDDANKEREELKAIVDKARQTPATENTTPIVDAAGKGISASSMKTLNEAVARFDSKGGKALGVAKAAVAMAQAARENVSENEIERRKHLPDGYIKFNSEANVSKMYDNPGAIEKAMAESTLSTGGALTPDVVLAEFIEVLRPMVALLAAGVVTLPMSSQSVSIPRQASDIAGSWVGENQNAPATAISTDEIQLRLKKWAALVAISNDLLRDNIIATDILVRDSMLAQAMLALDIAMIRGTGTAYTPKGIRNTVPASQLVSANAGSGSNTIGTAAVDLAQSQQFVETANVPRVKPVFLMHPRSKYGYAQLRDNVGRFYWADEIFNKNTLWGVPFQCTTQIPINLSGGGSGGSAESELYYVECSQWLLGMGLMPSIEVERNGNYYDGSNQQSGMSLDQTVIRIILRADFTSRHYQAATVVQGLTVQ